MKVKYMKQLSSCLHNFKCSCQWYWFECMLWMAGVFISLYCCYYLTWNTYSKWRNNPFVISFNEQPKDINQIPFPAVTICPGTKANKHVFNFTEIYHKSLKHDLTYEEGVRMEALFEICNFNPNKEIKKGSNIELNEDMEIIGAIKEMALTLTDTIESCGFLKKKCKHLFKEYLYEEGICFTFNAVDPQAIYKEGFYYDSNNQSYEESDWSPESGFDRDYDNSKVPYSSRAIGPYNGLIVTLQDFVENLDYICGGTSQGFKLYIHAPDEVPQMWRGHINTPFKQEMSISVKPNFIFASNDIRNYDSEKKKCYFSGERDLKYFKEYNKDHCELECITNFTLEYCNCVTLSMPRDNSTHICRYYALECYEYLSITIQESPAFLEYCHCLPTCFSLTYDVAVSQTDFESIQESEAFGEYWNDSIRTSKLRIYFEHQQFFPLKRAELYGAIDILANIGGLLGLFIGFSMLGFAQKIYKLSFKIVCMLMKSKEHFKRLNKIASQTDVQEKQIEIKHLNNLSNIV